jgi:glycosyltransferase involved in cell wall biosynthesis
MRNEGIPECDVVVAVSDILTNDLRSLGVLSVAVVPNGVDTQIFSPGASSQSGRPIAAWVGCGSEPSKDVGGFFALANSGLFPDFQFIMVDGSHESEEPTNWLPDGGIAMRRVDWREMPDFYRRVVASNGFLISTSQTDACPMSVLEAQACGCPVVAPRVGGIPQIVRDRVTGYLYDRHTGIEGVRKAVEWLYSADNYSTASRESVAYIQEGLTAAHTFSEYMALYRRAIEAHPAGALQRASRRIVSASIGSLLGIRSCLGRKHK